MFSNRRSHSSVLQSQSRYSPRLQEEGSGSAATTTARTGDCAGAPTPSLRLWRSLLRAQHHSARTIRHAPLGSERPD